MSAAINKLRTWWLCMITQGGVIALAWRGKCGGAETALALGVALGAWVGGKAWKSKMEAEVTP